MWIGATEKWSSTLRSPCDFESLPDDFDDDVLAVLSHASRLIRLEELVRHRLSPDTPLTPRTVADLAQRFAGVFEVKKTDKQDDNPSPEGAAKEDALTL